MRTFFFPLAFPSAHTKQTMHCCRWRKCNESNEPTSETNERFLLLILPCTTIKGRRGRERGAWTDLERVRRSCFLLSSSSLKKHALSSSSSPASQSSKGGVLRSTRSKVARSGTWWENGPHSCDQNSIWREKREARRRINGPAAAMATFAAFPLLKPVPCNTNM